MRSHKSLVLFAVALSALVMIAPGAAAEDVDQAQAVNVEEVQSRFIAAEEVSTVALDGSEVSSDKSTESEDHIGLVDPEISMSTLENDAVAATSLMEETAVIPCSYSICYPVCGEHFWRCDRDWGCICF